MAQTEITVQIFENIENVKAKLESLGYVWQDTFCGSDTYFSTLSAEQIAKADYKQLLDSSIIIRDFLKQKSGFHSTTLVHKLKTLSADGNVIGEQKTSVEINSAQDAKNLLTNAGLKTWIGLNQKNSFYCLGEKTIIVGTVDGLEGCFVEIEEYPSIKDKPEQQKFEILKQFVNDFGFEVGNDYSCKKIYMLYLKNLEK